MRTPGGSLPSGCAGAGPSGHNRALAAAQGVSASPVHAAYIHLHQVRNPHQILRVTSPLFNGKCFGMSREKKMDGVEQRFPGRAFRFTSGYQNTQTVLPPTRCFQKFPGPRGRPLCPGCGRLRGSCYLARPWHLGGSPDCWAPRGGDLLRRGGPWRSWPCGPGAGAREAPWEASGWPTCRNSRWSTDFPSSAHTEPGRCA